MDSHSHHAEESRPLTGGTRSSPSPAFTCPMHPEVRESARGACPKCGMTLVPVGRGAMMAASAVRYWLPLGVLGAVALFYLWTEHRAHLLGALPYLFLLACPLMHVFMHHGHGDQDGHVDHSGQRTP